MAARKIGAVRQTSRKVLSRNSSRASYIRAFKMRTATSSTSQNESTLSGTVGTGGAGIPAGGDIEELAFVVLMSATNDQDNDLQEIMNEVQALTAAKLLLRAQERQLQIIEAQLATSTSGETLPKVIRNTIADVLRHLKL
jgi:hypothetical protein